MKRMRSTARINVKRKAHCPFCFRKYCNTHINVEILDWRGTVPKSNQAAVNWQGQLPKGVE